MVFPDEVFCLPALMSTRNCLAMHGHPSWIPAFCGNDVVMPNDAVPNDVVAAMTLLRE